MVVLLLGLFLQVTATINRGRMKRCFLEWRDLCQQRRWKTQLAARDAQVGGGGGEVYA